MTDLLLCLLVLIAQLGILHYLDQRVAAMPRLSDVAPRQPDEALISAIDALESGVMPGRRT